MRSNLIASVVSAVIITTSYMSIGADQQSGQTMSQDSNAYMQTSPHCMMRDGMGVMMDQKTMDRMMNKMGMSPSMQRCYQMMMTTQISPEDPAAILALKNDLNLTSEQISKINDIIDNSHTQTMSLLSDKQKEQLKQMKDVPNNMTNMCNYMMQSIDKVDQENNTGSTKRDYRNSMHGCSWNKSDSYCW